MMEIIKDILHYILMWLGIIFPSDYIITVIDMNIMIDNNCKFTIYHNIITIYL